MRVVARTQLEAPCTSAKASSAQSPGLGVWRRNLGHVLRDLGDLTART
jgi:hypothetical protein